MKNFITLCAATLVAATALSPVAAQPPAASRGVAVRPVPENNSRLDVKIWADQQTYRVGESIKLSYRTNRDAHVIIFSTDSRGETRQIFPNHYDRDNKVEGGETNRIPGRNYRLQVTPPSGYETITIAAFRKSGRSLERFRSNMSSKNPFPRASSSDARAVIRGIEPGEPEGRGYAVDSVRVRVIGRDDGRGDGRGDGEWGRGDGNWGRGDGNWGDRDNDRGRGRLRIESDPSAAYVYLNEQYYGITPIDARDLRAGRYNVTIQRAGFQPVRRSITVQDDATVRLDEDLKPIRY